MKQSQQKNKNHLIGSIDLLENVGPLVLHFDHIRMILKNITKKQERRHKNEKKNVETN